MSPLENNCQLLCPSSMALIMTTITMLRLLLRQFLGQIESHYICYCECFRIHLLSNTCHNSWMFLAWYNRYTTPTTARTLSPHFDFAVIFWASLRPIGVKSPHNAEKSPDSNFKLIKTFTANSNETAQCRRTLFLVCLYVFYLR